uniref:Uncharacterized protein n=1 Tax=Amphimedon queenslandica TaxID=400682 RepID=A0A1X7U9F1_AMPQE
MKSYYKEVSTINTVGGLNKYCYLKSEVNCVTAGSGSLTSFSLIAVQNTHHKTLESTCTKQFRLQFNDMFHKVLIKGQVLGPVSEFYYEKENQASGAFLATTV